MRRKDREIINREELINIFEKGDVCRIAINTDNAPYIVPLNYGYSWDDKRIEIYFHCAIEGRKIDLLSKNNVVGFEIDIDHELIQGDHPCKWGMKYKSIIGTGTVVEITDINEKKLALDKIMIHYGFKSEIKYDDEIFKKTKILKMELDEISGKQRI